jgi:hypothetical protein
MFLRLWCLWKQNVSIRMWASTSPAAVTRKPAKIAAAMQIVTCISWNFVASGAEVFGFCGAGIGICSFAAESDQRRRVWVVDLGLYEDSIRTVSGL